MFDKHVVSGIQNSQAIGVTAVLVKLEPGLFGKEVRFACLMQHILNINFVAVLTEALERLKEGICVGRKLIKLSVLQMIKHFWLVRILDCRELLC